MKCAQCCKEVKYIVQHLSRSNNCKIPEGIDAFKIQFKFFKQVDSDKLKEKHRRHMEVFRMKKREEDSENVKEQQRKHKRESMMKKREEDIENVKEQQRKRKRLSLSKKRAMNPKQVLADQNDRQKRHRNVTNRSDRLQEFREATKYAAIFICICCQQRMFHSNVQLFTDKLKKEIDKVKLGHIQACMEKK